MKTFLFADGSIESYEPNELHKTVHVKGSSGENLVRSQEHFETADAFMAALVDARARHAAEDDAKTLADATATVKRKADEAAALKAAQEKAAKDALTAQANRMLSDKADADRYASTKS